MRLRYIAALLIYLLFSSTASALSVVPGTRAPDFNLPSIDGKTTSLSEFRDSIVVIVYWRPDQRRSLMALSDLRDLHERHGEKGVRVIAITAESENKERIIEIIKNLKIDFPVLLDPAREVYGNYGIRVYPTTLIIDKKGNLANSLPGHALTYKRRVEGPLRYMLGEIDEEKLKKMLSPTKKDKDRATLQAERRYNLALNFTQSRLIDHAVDIAKKSIEAKPDFIKPHVLLGFLYLRENEVDLAIKEFRTVMEIDPLSLDARTGLGSALLLNGELESAMNILSSSLLSNPYPERTYFELGRVYELRGNNNLAIEMYRKVLDKIMRKGVLPKNIARCR